MAAFRTGRQVLPAADGAPEQIRLAVVTVNFFRVMGAPIALGRDFGTSFTLVLIGGGARHSIQSPSAPSHPPILLRLQKDGRPLVAGPHARGSLRAFGVGELDGDAPNRI